MRVRRVLNFYDDEPDHLDLLGYLDGVHGETRRSQLLTQMVLIGFRVMARHESGEEALFHTRNPDLSRILSRHPKEVSMGGMAIRAPRKKGRVAETYDANGEAINTENVNGKAPARPSRKASASSPAGGFDHPIGQDRHHALPHPTPSAVEAHSPPASFVEVEFDDLLDGDSEAGVLDPLALLQRMSGG